MSLIPAPHPVGHISRGVNELGTKDAHGNFPRTTSGVVIRYAQSIIASTFGTSRSRQVFNTQTVDREATTYEMAVPDPEMYKSGDQVLLFGTVSGSDYTGGTAFSVDGDPTDSRLGPWPQFYKSFGGVVKLRRVT